MKTVAADFVRVLTALLLAAMFCAESYAWSGDAVVIGYGDFAVTRTQLERRFQIAIQLLAQRQGISLADQEPTAVAELRDQYLEKYARDLVFLREADRRQLVVSKAEVDRALAEILSQADNNEFSDDVLLREVIRDEQTIALLNEAMLEEIRIPPGDVITMHHDVKDGLATPEEFCVRHIQVDSVDAANDIRAQLEQGADFREVAVQQSTDAASAQNGGDLGCFARLHSQSRSEFETAVFTAREGELVGPVDSELGQHILVVYRHNAPRVPTLDEAYADIERELALEQLPAHLQLLITDSGIDVYPDGFRISSN
jgi:parvulin-like peptidyl-prolyl isomerase